MDVIKHFLLASKKRGEGAASNLSIVGENGLLAHQTDKAIKKVNCHVLAVEAMSILSIFSHYFVK